MFFDRGKGVSVIAVEVVQTTLAVIIGLFVLRMFQKLLTARNGGQSRVAAALEFLLGP